MTQRRIDPTLYISAADEFQAITESASTRLADARSSLHQFARMAGDDPGGEQFAGAYDTMARDALQALSDIAVLSNTMDRAIMQSGWNHALAEEAAGGDPAGAFTVRPARTPVTVGAPPSAYGGSGGEPEAWDVVKDFVGMMWPNADTDKLRSAGSTWDVVERDVRSLATEIRQADDTLMGLNSIELVKLRSEVNEFARDVTMAAGDISEVGDLCREYADDVKDAHREVIEMLVQLAIEIAATVAIGAALSVFTFGASAVAAGGGIAARILVIAQRIVGILVRVSGTAARLVARLAAISARIAPLANRFKRTATLVVNAASGTLAAGGSELAVQRGDANLLVAMGGGFVGGAVTDTVALAFGRYGQRVLVQALAGGAGGAVSGASSGLLSGTGVDIRQVIIGGAGGSVAGGGFAVRGRRGGTANSADPGRGNIDVPGADGPRPPGGDGPGAGNGGGAVGTRPDYDGPQVSGGNDAGSGSGNGGGTGRQPDYDGPQTSGGNDPGASTGDGGGIRVPDGEAPQSPHVDVTPEPTTGGTDVPTPTQGGADVPTPTQSGTDVLTATQSGPDVPTPTQGGAGTPTTGGVDASAPGSHTPAAPDDISRQFDDLQADIDRQFDDLEADIDRQFDDLEADIDRQFDDLEADIDRQFDDLQTRIDEAFDDLQADIDRQFDDLEADVDRGLDESGAGAGGAGEHADVTGEGAAPTADGTVAGGVESAEALPLIVDGPDQLGRPDFGDGLSDTARVEIAAMEKGSRPDPATYLSPQYIADHLAKFDGGAVRFMTGTNLGKYGIAQSDGTAFVLPRTEVDALLASAGGDLRALEAALGLPDRFFDSGIVRVDIPAAEYDDLRIPSGNEAGANPQWIPGGHLPTGVSEAVIDAGDLPDAAITVSPI